MAITLFIPFGQIKKETRKRRRVATIYTSYTGGGGTTTAHTHVRPVIINVRESRAPRSALKSFLLKKEKVLCNSTCCF
jgi:hypothetical protein